MEIVSRISFLFQEIMTLFIQMQIQFLSNNFSKTKTLYHRNINSSCARSFAYQKDLDIVRWYESGKIWQLMISVNWSRDLYPTDEKPILTSVRRPVVTKPLAKFILSIHTMQKIIKRITYENIR